jgi:uncharacterized protein
LSSKESVKKLVRIHKEPSVLLVGIPGPGLIGTLSLNYVIHSLKMDIIGEVENPEMAPVVFIDNGEIFGPIRIYKSGSLFVVLSDTPIDYELAPGFSQSIVEFAKKNEIDMIVIPSGIHAPDRDVENAKTYGLVTDEKLDTIMYENEIPKFLSGVIAGPDAIILTYLRNSPIPSLILFTECNLFFPDPESAIHTIKIIAKIVKRNIDLAEFKKQINFLRLQGRHLMEETLNVIQQEKESTSPPQIYK